MRLRTEAQACRQSLENLPVSSLSSREFMTLYPENGRPDAASSRCIGAPLSHQPPSTRATSPSHTGSVELGDRTLRGHVRPLAAPQPTLLETLVKRFDTQLNDKYHNTSPASRVCSRSASEPRPTGRSAAVEHRQAAVADEGAASSRTLIGASCESPDQSIDRKSV